jgi:hypothetical protein
MQVTTLKAREHQAGRRTEESGKYLGRFEPVRAMLSALFKPR